MTDESLLVCPICGRLIALEANGDIPYHDNIPPCRSVCRAAKRSMAEAMRIREIDDEIRRDYYSGPPGSFTGD